MELWVRSQNKMLLEKVDGITLDIKCLEIYSTRTGRILGNYKTKERTLEVLNEIQEHIGFIEVEISAGRGGELDFQSDIVYQMPEK